MDFPCFLWVLAVGLANPAPAPGQEPIPPPALRTIGTREGGRDWLANGTFEALKDGQVQAWKPWQSGFAPADAQGRAGSRAVRCERTDAGGEFGAGQSLNFDRPRLGPFLIRGWSRAENVSGSPDSGYSIYADLLYEDGTPLWGQHVGFSCGSHDWEERELIILPDKPVRSLTLYGLFRGHTGRVWFDDFSVREVEAPEGAVNYQGLPVEAPSPTPRALGAETRVFATDDQLLLKADPTGAVALSVGGRAFLPVTPSGFLARDTAAHSDVYPFAQGTCPALGLELQSEVRAHPNHLEVRGMLRDTTGRDRAITLVFALPIDATGWRWGDDVRASRRIEGAREYMNVVHLRAGATGTMSRYPLAAIWDQDTGLALGLDMDQPALYRLACHPAARQLLIAYDLGLAPETTAHPGAAAFRFVIYRFDPRWGFRAALQRFYDIFPGHFVKRVPREGVWMPFTDIAKVPAFEDFGFAFQEGAPNVAFDDRHGITSFVYVEPMSHWLPMPPNAPRTYEDALNVLQGDLEGRRSDDLRRMASATLSSGMHRADGRYALYLQKAPWCDGGVFFLNPLPDIPTTATLPWTKASVMKAQIDQAFARHQPNPPTSAPWPGLDGVYLDSLEMAASELNYRREHFPHAEVPLTYDLQGRVGQLMIFNTWEFARQIARQHHASNHLMFANGVLWNYSFPAPLLDVLGTEVNWLPQGRFQPDSDAVMNFRRALCGPKPYCLLMNTDFHRLEPALVERYFQTCLLYGIWPGFFDEEAASKDPYWASSKRWFERDRGLFKKYIPLLRLVTEAGWHPITGARTDNPHFLLERFGPDSRGTAFLCVFNDADTPQQGQLTLDPEPEANPARQTATRKLVADTEGPSLAPSGNLQLAPQSVEILAIDAFPKTPP